MRRPGPLLALVGVTAIWGVTFVQVQDALALYPLFAFLAVRFTISTVVLAPFAIRPLLRLPREGYLVGVGVGALLATGAVSKLLDARIVRYPHRPFVNRAWELRGQLTPYDAVYVALAEALGATLVTTDRRLARAVTTVEVAVPS